MNRKKQFLLRRVFEYALEAHPSSTYRTKAYQRKHSNQAIFSIFKYEVFSCILINTAQNIQKEFNNFSHSHSVQKFRTDFIFV